MSSISNPSPFLTSKVRSIFYFLSLVLSLTSTLDQLLLLHFMNVSPNPFFLILINISSITSSAQMVLRMRSKQFIGYLLKISYFQIYSQRHVVARVSPNVLKGLCPSGSMSFMPLVTFLTVFVMVFVSLGFVLETNYLISLPVATFFPHQKLHKVYLFYMALLRWISLANKMVLDISVSTPFSSLKMVLTRMTSVFYWMVAPWANGWVICLSHWTSCMPFLSSVFQVIFFFTWIWSMPTIQLPSTLMIINTSPLL